MFLYFLERYHARYTYLFCCFGVGLGDISFLCGYKGKVYVSFFVVLELVWVIYPSCVGIKVRYTYLSLLFWSWFG